VLADGFYLFDTPGMLWPRIIVAKSGYNLAASGAIGRNAFNEEEVALELLDYLIPNYPDLLKARYKVELPAGITDEQLLEEIGRKRGAVLSKGRINLQKAAEIVSRLWGASRWRRRRSLRCGSKPGKSSMPSGRSKKTRSSSNAWSSSRKSPARPRWTDAATTTEAQLAGWPWPTTVSTEPWNCS
jgi:ribosome biogenesis GTPase A